MKRFLVLAMVFMSFVLLFASDVRAKVVTSEKLATVGTDEVIDDDLFLSGEEVIFEGIVNGDLFAAGGRVIIDGVVNGDVIVVGGTIEISGVIEDDVRAVGGDIRIDGATIGDGVALGGGNINIDRETIIGGGLVFGGGSIESEASVSRGVTGGGGSVWLEGEIGKDVQVGAGTLTLGSNTTVLGDLVWSGEEEPRINEEAIIAGEIREFIPKGLAIGADLDTRQFEKRAEGFLKGLDFGLRVWSYFAALVVGAVMFLLFKKPGMGISDALQNNMLSSVGWGLVVLFLTGPVLLLIAITGVGIPLAMILGAVFVIDLYLAKLFVGVVLGRWLKKVFGQQSVNKFVAFALGLALFYILTALKFVGLFVSFVGLLAGLGAQFIYTRDQLNKGRKS